MGLLQTGFWVHACCPTCVEMSPGTQASMIAFFGLFATFAAACLHSSTMQEAVHAALHTCDSTVTCPNCGEHAAPLYDSHIGLNVVGWLCVECSRWQPTGRMAWEKYE